jgi:hypothetical protein
VQQKYSVSTQKANSFVETENKLARVILLVLWSYVYKIHKQEHVGGFVIFSLSKVG